MTGDQATSIAEQICDCGLQNTPVQGDQGRLQGDWDRDGDGNRDFIVLVEHPGVPGRQHIHIEVDTTGDDANKYVERIARVLRKAAAGKLVVSGGPYFIAVEVGDFVQRFQTSATGAYSAILPPNMEGLAHLYDPVSGFVKHTRILTAPNGTNMDLFHQTESDWQVYMDANPCDYPPDVEHFCYPDIVRGSALWTISRRLDSDGDGLPDDIEFVIGTIPNDPDSDDDGLPDGAEVAQGTNPLDGLVAETGLLSSVDTPGSAVDVCALNDVASCGRRTGRCGLGSYIQQWVGQTQTPIRG